MTFDRLFGIYLGFWGHVWESKFFLVMKEFEESETQRGSSIQSII